MRGAARAARLVVMAATGTGTGTGHKRPHPEPAPRIGTHDGTFHCDEALACFLLRLLPRYRDAEIVRTRDPQRLAGCDVVVDVGGEYDPGRHRYDHHQRSFTESMRSLRPDKPWSTKLSSAGLVYCHFGAQILAGLLGQPEDGPVVSALYDKLYENFVEEIDAMDNGIAPAAGEPRYALSTTLSARVGHLNPRWNDPDQDTEAGFRRAMELVGTEFLQRLDFYHRAWLPARALVEEAVRRRLEVDASGQVLELSQGGCPWKEHLFQLERELALPRPLLLVLFPDRGGQWRVQSVPTAPHSFQSRLPLPEAWRGLRDEALSELAGIPGCVFVHASGFIGGNRTREGALEMARRALELGGGTESTAMRAAGLLLLLLLLLGLPQQPRAGSRCPGGAPPVPLAPSGHNETLGRAAGTARAPDVAALVALGGWLGLVLLCVRRFVRRSREETRLHLRALPCGAHRERREEEEEPLSGGTGSQPGGPGG